MLTVQSLWCILQNKQRKQIPTTEDFLSECVYYIFVLQELICSTKVWIGFIFSYVKLCCHSNIINIHPSVHPKMYFNSIILNNNNI